MSPARCCVWLWASGLAAACAGPTLDLGESLRDASQDDGSAHDGGAHDGGAHAAGTRDAGCRDDDDCTSASLAHCAVDSGLCVPCTQNSHCASNKCEYERGTYHCDDF